MNGKINLWDFGEQDICIPHIASSKIFINYRDSSNIRPQIIW